ncbi:MAG: ThiF family adenylyltransferase, partial [Rhodospirillaceae bacterium]
LQRQVIHATERIGTPKVESAAKAVAAINPDVRIEAHAVRLGAGNVMDLIAGYDVIAGHIAQWSGWRAWFD